MVSRSLLPPQASSELRYSVLFREVNNRIREVSVNWGEPAEPIEFLCECGNDECSEVLGLTIGEYDEMRSSPNRFLLRRGHESAGVEDVIAHADGHLVVEKRTLE